MEVGRSRSTSEQFTLNERLIAAQHRSVHGYDEHAKTEERRFRVEKFIRLRKERS